jgi:hypothetical protein
MNWLREALFKILKSAIDTLVQEAMDKAIKELNEEIDASFEDEKERESLKFGIAMLRARVSIAIQERL